MTPPKKPAGKAVIFPQGGFAGEEVKDARKL